MDFSTAPSSVTVGQSSSSTSVKEADNALLLPKVQAELVSTCPPPINKESLISVSPFPIHSGYIVREKIGQVIELRLLYVEFKFTLFQTEKSVNVSPA